MKSINIFFLSLLICCCTFKIHAQNEKSIQDIKDLVSSFILQLESGNYYKVVNSIIDSVENIETKAISITLDPSHEYYVTAFGNDKIFSLTLKISDGSPEEIQYNAASTQIALPYIVLKPIITTLYNLFVNVKQYCLDYTSGHFAVIIYYKLQ